MKSYKKAPTDRTPRLSPGQQKAFQEHQEALADIQMRQFAVAHSTGLETVKSSEDLIKAATSVYDFVKEGKKA